MRSSFFLASLCTVLLSGCAEAALAHATAEPPPALASSQTAADRASIEDTEPDVTREVAAILDALAQGSLPRERLTERASGELGAPAVAGMRTALRGCAQPVRLTLLERKTKGEDRQYLYRAACAPQALLVEIDYNKAARVNRLVLRPAQ
jgi:hypothetical protein